MAYSAAERALLEKIVTNVDGSVYFFTGDQPPELVGAAMARVSRAQADPRGIWLGEFSADGLARTEDLIRRVVSEYGDDSVQQLVPVQFVTSRISNLMTKLVEWPRIGMAYLEQSTRYIFFDERDADGNWQYYVPPNLPPELNELYLMEMNAIFQAYSEIVHHMFEYFMETRADQRGDLPEARWRSTIKAQACDAVRAMLPVATRSTVAFTGNAQSLENLVMTLRSYELAEAQDLANALTHEARKQPYLAPFLERVDLADRGLATSAYRRTTRDGLCVLTQELLADGLLGHQPAMFSELGPHVALLDFEPKDECELLAWMMFPYAEGYGIEALRRYAAQMSLPDQELVMAAAIGERLNRRHKPGRSFERAHFWWEVLDEYASYRDLQRHRMVDAWDWQPLTANYGFSVPDAIREVGDPVLAKYLEAFHRSARLYRWLMDDGFSAEAQYATLLGHRMRYSFGTNLRELFHLIELRTQPAGHAGYRAIANTMFDQVAGVYPRLAEGMRFVNTKGESDELTRLAGERATAMKLNEL